METIEIDYNNIKLEVSYEYYKGSPPVFYYPDGSGHPGDPPEVDIIKITADDVCYLLDFLSTEEKAVSVINSFYKKIEEKIFEYEEKQETIEDFDI